jgi:hypothetical protein
MAKCCLVTICIGEKYLQQYNSLFRESQENYAKKCGYDFKIITDYIKEPRHFSVISFNKVLVCDYNWSSEYDFIIFVDADVIINKNAPPIHDFYEFGDKIGVVNQSQPTLQARFAVQKHKTFLRDIFDKYSKQQINHKSGFHYEQSVSDMKFKKTTLITLWT